MAAEMKNASGLLYCGRPLASMTREELIEALVTSHRQFLDSVRNFLELAELNQKLIERAKGR